MFLACAAVLALRLSTNTEPMPSPSATDDPNSVSAQVPPMPESPAGAITPKAREPNGTHDADTDSVPSELPSREPSALSEPPDLTPEQGGRNALAHQPQAAELQEVIRGILVDIEGNPIAGYVSLEFTDQNPNAVPATTFAIPLPTHQLPGGVIGHAHDVSGELARRFVWRKGSPDEEMTIVLEPYAAIVGQLVDGARKPVAGARPDLQVPMLDGRWRADIGALDTPAIEEEGYFTLDRVPVGTDVRIAARRGAFSGQSRQIVLTPGDVANAGQIVMTGPRPGTGVVQGRITDEHGLPITDRPIMIRLARRGQWLRTDAAGYYLLTDLPAGQPITIELEVAPYGLWSRTTTPDDLACDFQLSPQGAGLLAREAPPLFPARWFNHAPRTLEQLKGRVVLLAFRRFSGDADPGLARLRRIHSEYAPRGLATIAVYDHLPVTDPLAADIVAGHLAALFAGTTIAGFLDTEPEFIADLMPPERPSIAAAGATHWMYQVHARPAFYLIDKEGIVRHVADTKSKLNDHIQRLLAEQPISPTP
jgi:hypothetical protein